MRLTALLMTFALSSTAFAILPEKLPHENELTTTLAPTATSHTSSTADTATKYVAYVVLSTVGLFTVFAWCFGCVVCWRGTCTKDVQYFPLEEA